MQVRDWQEIVRDVVESEEDAAGWEAIAGPRARGVGEDLYLAHPRSGVYQLKTYTKNPFERKGVGSKVARSLDDEIGSYLPNEGTDRFAVHSRPASKRQAESRAQRVQDTFDPRHEVPGSPDELFNELMHAIESPAFGPLTFDADTRPEPLDGLAGTFDEAESVLNAEMEDLIDEDGIGRGFN